MFLDDNVSHEEAIQIYAMQHRFIDRHTYHITICNTHLLFYCYKLLIFFPRDLQPFKTLFVEKQPLTVTSQ